MVDKFKGMFSGQKDRLQGKGLKLGRVTTDRLGVLQVMAGAVSISFSAVMVKLAQVGPSTSAFYRVSIGGAALLIFALIRRDRLWAGFLPLAGAAACGLFFSLDLIFWHRSIIYVGPGLGTLLANFQVFFIALAAILFMGDRLTARLAVSIPLSVLGLMMIVAPEWRKLGPNYQLGVWLGLATAFWYTFYLLILRRSMMLSPRLSQTGNIAIVSIVCTAILGLDLLRAGESLAVPDLGTGAALLVYGLGCHAVGWVLIATGLPKFPASRGGLVLLIQPTCSFIWDVLFFNRPLNLFQALGAGLALTAIYLGSSRGRG